MGWGQHLFWSEEANAELFNSASHFYTQALLNQVLQPGTTCPMGKI